MVCPKVQLFAAACLLCMFARCNTPSNPTSSMNAPDTNLIDRAPAVAGQFYPSNTNELRRMVTGYFQKLKTPDHAGATIAVISPHAGYVFSGEVAAAAFNELDPGKQYKTVFVIGCSHRNAFSGGSVYTCGDYLTPLGRVSVDREIAMSLSASSKYLAFDPQYHRNEHSIEVQIPFLQEHLQQPFKIVPILLGTHDPGICRSISQSLKPYFTEDNVFIISSDFSHYPGYEDAYTVDNSLAEAILSNDPGRFIQAEKDCRTMEISNLATGCCSWPAVLTLMYLTEKSTDYSYKQVLYKNSGDSRYGDKQQVVGYHAISLVRRNQQSGEFTLGSIEREKLLSVARETIASYLTDRSIPEIDPGSLPPALLQKAGAFVTLKKNGDLRGCIGHFEADKALYAIVQQMAVASSTQDYRFSPVTFAELKQIEIEISVLTPMKRVQSVSEIKLGRDGIYIRKGGRSGTFLPQVASETGWSLDEFLGHCARDKAGIGWDGWKDKDAEIYTYQALVFHE